MRDENDIMGESQNAEGTRRRSSRLRKHCYQDLLNRLEIIQENDNVGLDTAKDLREILQEVNSVERQSDFVDRVDYSDETLLGSNVLSSASGMVVRCIENMNITTSVYETTKFAEKFVSEVKTPGEEFHPKDWLKLLGDACEIIPDLPDFSFLYGAVDPTKIPEPKQRKERTKQDSNERMEKKKPQTVDTVEGDEVDEDSVNFLQKVLKDTCKKNNSKPIPYFDFVIDSEDFGATVENMFYCSFLIRDGKAELAIGENGKPTLRPMRKRDLKEFRDNGGVNTQMISSISMGDWEVLAVKEGYVEKYKKQLQLR